MARLSKSVIPAVVLHDCTAGVSSFCDSVVDEAGWKHVAPTCLAICGTVPEALLQWHSHGYDTTLKKNRKWEGIQRHSNHRYAEPRPLDKALGMARTHTVSAPVTAR